MFLRAERTRNIETGTRTTAIAAARATGSLPTLVPADIAGCVPLVVGRASSTPEDPVGGAVVAALAAGSARATATARNGEPGGGRSDLYSRTRSTAAPATTVPTARVRAAVPARSATECRVGCTVYPADATVLAAVVEATATSDVDVERFTVRRRSGEGNLTPGPPRPEFSHPLPSPKDPSPPLSANQREGDRVRSVEIRRSREGLAGPGVAEGRRLLRRRRGVVRDRDDGRGSRGPDRATRVG